MDDEEKSNLKNNILAYSIILILSFCIIFFGSKHFGLKGVITPKETKYNYYKAKIISVDKIQNDISTDISTIISERYNFKARVELDNKEKIEVFGIQNITEGSNKEAVKVDDKVIVGKSENSEIYHFVEYDRATYLVIFIILMIILTVIVAKFKGLNTIISLGINTLIIFMVYIPAIISGVNIYLATILLAVYVIVTGLILLNGINKKTIAAIIGNILGVALSAILAVIANKIFKITGIINEDSMYIRILDISAEIDLLAVAWAGIVIGALRSYNGYGYVCCFSNKRSVRKHGSKRF